MRIIDMFKNWFRSDAAPTAPPKSKLQQKLDDCGESQDYEAARRMIAEKAQRRRNERTGLVTNGNGH